MSAWYAYRLFSVNRILAMQKNCNIVTLQGPSDSRYQQYTVQVPIGKIAAVMRYEDDYPAILVDGVWVKIDPSELSRAEAMLAEEP